MNAWPLDEGLIDYVDAGYGTESDQNGLYTANVIANASIEINGETIDAGAITPDLLATKLHEAGDVPLLGRHRPGTEPELFAGQSDLCRSMKHYVGSLAANVDGTLVAATSPRGNMAVILEAGTGRIVSTRTMPEVCGAASDGSGFAHSTPAGLLDIQGRAFSSPAVAAWDNHLLRI